MATLTDDIHELTKIVRDLDHRLVKLETKLEVYERLSAKPRSRRLPLTIRERPTPGQMDLFGSSGAPCSYEGLNYMALSPLGCAISSVPDFIQTELQPVLAITFDDRNDKPCDLSHVGVSSPILTWQGSKILVLRTTGYLPK
ncbi:MAG: hypothetical protein FJ244_07895 [Nitrospira sp.]|nr:hypothetical protein [Nitrospira sp.]